MNSQDQLTATARLVASEVNPRTAFVSRPQGMLLLGTTSKIVFARTVLAGGVRTKKLPAERRTWYSREDLERVARESINTGQPQQSA